MKQQQFQQRRQQDSLIHVEKSYYMKRRRVGMLPQNRHSYEPTSRIYKLSLFVIAMIIACDHVNATSEKPFTIDNQKSKLRLATSSDVLRKSLSENQEAMQHWRFISKTESIERLLILNAEAAERQGVERKLDQVDLDQVAQSVNDDELPAIEDSASDNDNDGDGIQGNTTSTRTNSSDVDFDVSKNVTVDDRPDVTFVNITMNSKFPTLSVDNITNVDYHKDKPIIVFDDYDEILDLESNATNLSNETSHESFIPHNDTTYVTSAYNGTENSFVPGSNATSAVDASQSLNNIAKNKTKNDQNTNSKLNNGSFSEDEEGIETSIFDMNNPFNNGTDESASAVREESLHSGNDTTDDDSKFDTSKSQGIDESATNSHSTTKNGSSLDTSIPNKNIASGEVGMINENFENNSIDGISNSMKNSKSLGLEQSADSNELLKELNTEERRFEIIFVASISISVILMIFTAYQMSENPDGLYASLCRFTISIILFIWSIIRYPCHKPSVRISHQPYNHLPLSTKEYGYNDPALEIT